jgi:hypothetical protein
MSARDTSINDTSFVKLLHNDNYYRHIFKKTEKIVSVVFYIINNITIDKKSETIVSNIASKAHFAHENALRTLEVKPVSSKEVLEQFAQALVGLESTLRIAGATATISPEVLQVVFNEIDAVLRGLRGYIQTNDAAEGLFLTQSPYSSFSGDALPLASAPSSAPRRREAKVPAPVAKEAAADDRRERIKTILEAKGEATIKDISQIITDCSEKTVQRELNAMIEDNIVKRQGERRWSRYSLY